MINLLINSRNIPKKVKLQVGTPRIEAISKIQSLRSNTDKQRTVNTKQTNFNFDRVEFSSILSEKINDYKSHK